MEKNRNPTGQREVVGVGKGGCPLPRVLVRVQRVQNVYRSGCHSSTHPSPQQCPSFADDSLPECPWNCTKVCPKFRFSSEVEGNPSHLTDP